MYLGTSLASSRCCLFLLIPSAALTQHRGVAAETLPFHKQRLTLLFSPELAAWRTCARISVNNGAAHRRNVRASFGGFGWLYIPASMNGSGVAR